MMSGVSKHLRRKYTSIHHPSLVLLPHQDPWQPQWHLNPTSPLPTSKRGLKGCKCIPIFKNERYYNTFIRHFKATAKAQGLSTLMDPNFTPGSDEYEQQLFQEQQDFLYSVLISSLKTDFSEALVKDHEGDAQLILELLHEHHTGNSQYSRSEINRITKYLTNIKLDDTWRGTNESFLMHYNDQLRSLTLWLIQRRNSLITQESLSLSLQLNLFQISGVSRSQTMCSKHSLIQQDPSHTSLTLTC